MRASATDSGTLTVPIGFAEDMMRIPFQYSTSFFVLICVVGSSGLVTRADVTVLGVQYRPDQAFPEHQCFWNDSQFPGPCSTPTPLGASIHVMLRNNGASSVTVQDVMLAGQSMAQVLVLHFQVVKRQPASIWLDNLPADQLQALLAAGEPVWYKVDPSTIAPGGTAQVVVRMRQTPSVPSIAIDVIHSAGTTSAVVPVDPTQPRAVSIGFSADLRKVYVYWQRSPAGAAPTTIFFDGTNVTASTTTVSDPTVNLSASVVQLSQALSPGSFHVFQGVYADGQKATTGVRAWNNEFIYGTWGANDIAAQSWINDATNHFFNSLVVQLGSSVLGDYLKTTAGKQYAADRGYGFVIDDIGKWGCSTPLMWFVRDEPDAADSRVTDIPADKMIGSLAQMAVGTGEAFRVAYPAAPTALNLDMTYKPFNWYNYGQVADVTMSDPYYQARLREASWTYPNRIPLYSKATFVYAVAQLAKASSEPNPLHVILYSCEYIDAGQIFPFPTPQSKRIEVYYALAGGAKGISYWWYLRGSPSNGLGDGGTEAQALWKEMGLLGAEIRTAAPLLVTSTPATMSLQSTPGLWTRALLVGADTFILLVVNDQYSNDQQGCHYTPVANASVTVGLPTWMPSPDAFEIATAGPRDVSTQIANGQIQLNLGTLDLTRMIVVTANPQLRSTIQSRFDQLVRLKACALSPPLCAQPTPPTISQHPTAQKTLLGGNATFSVQAQGTAPLSYAWQRNQVNLTNSAPYSGVLTPALTISGASTSQEGAYRCRVTNPGGTTSSNEAGLVVTTPDFDRDGDVDVSDFAHLQLCLGVGDVSTVPSCVNSDFDSNVRVDQADLAAFLKCLRGPGDPVVTNCLSAP